MGNFRPCIITGFIMDIGGGVCGGGTRDYGAIS